MLRTLAAIAALVTPLAALCRLYRHSLPTVAGKLTASGLQKPVEIVRDRWGVPHIYAQNEADLLFAQGYVHAQDRLWQMEMSRRLGHGHLAEIVGEAAFPADRAFRIIGLARAACRDLEHLDANTRRALESYAAGVNACIRASRGRLPLELRLLRVIPEPWQPLDSLVWGKLQGWALSHNWDVEILNAALVGRLGVEKAAVLKPEYFQSNPLIMAEQTCTSIFGDLQKQFRQAQEWLPGLALESMSNNWVVDGEKSSTGKPMLANDPHMTLSIPGLWYENHLSAPGFEVSGVSFPGSPGVVIGHNAEIAWGVTNALPDVQDIYVEKFHPGDPTLYEYENEWLKAEIIREEVRVRGESQPRVLEVTVTRHGPIVDPLLALKPAGDSFRLALRWAGQEPGNLSRAILKMNRAANWQDFCEALRDFDVPAQNFVYADRAGHIGLYVAGKVPLRASGEGLAPVPGWTGEHEWQGWIPFEELPHTLDPSHHYFATANNRVVGEEYQYCFSHEQYNGFRARRIVDMLSGKGKLSRADFAEMQNDVYCLPAQEFCALLLEDAEAILADPTLAENGVKAQQALNLIRLWDYRLSPLTVPGAIYELTGHFAARHLFRPWLEDLTDYYLGKGVYSPASYNGLQVDNSQQVLRRLLAENASEWFRDERGEPVTRAHILALALNDTIIYLTLSLGEDLGKWRWGRIHQLEFQHVLGRRKPLHLLFNRGPYPLGGDADTIAAAFTAPVFPIPTGMSGPSWRQIIDLSDWDASLAVTPTGQSGHPASRHYDDMISLWRQGQYHPMLWSREKVENNAETRLTLVP